MATHADFMLDRERLGISRADVAATLGFTIRTVDKWERPGDCHPPQYAWEWLDQMREKFDFVADSTVDMAIRNIPQNSKVGLIYYRNQEEYDILGRGVGLYGMANAITRTVVDRLADSGYDPVVMFPDEVGGVSDDVIMLT